MIAIKSCTTDKEIHELADCAKDIWNEYFISIITQKQIDYMVDKFQSYPALKVAIEEDGYTYYLAYEDAHLIGYCGIRIDGNRLFLSKLYLRNEMRGKGLASQLFQKALSFAKSNNLTAIYLTCNKYNTHSLDVYKHKGFHVIDSVQTDIGHDMIMDDYILQLDLV